MDQDDDVLTIRGQHQLDQLAGIPATVTSVKIAPRVYRAYSRQNGRLPDEADKIDGSVLSHLPSHVKKLSLEGVLVMGLVRLAEGLEELAVLDIDAEVPLLEWVLPQSLQHFTLMANEFTDLRAVTAPAITVVMQTAWPEGEPDMNRQFLLPESLAELTIDNGTGAHPTRMTFPELVDGRIYPDDYRTEAMNAADAVAAMRRKEPLNRATSTVIVLIPPHLEHLTLVHSDAILNYGPSQLSKVKSLRVQDVNDPVDFEGLFPQLEHLELNEITQWFNQNIELPKLKSFSIDYRGAASARRGMVIRASALEALTLRNCTPRYPQVIISNIGASLIELVLDNVVPFPVVKEWERLESVTVTNASVELPFIQYLQELELGQPQTTNGYEVRDLYEYKQAWGLSTRKKRPPTAAEIGY